MLGDGGLHAGALEDRLGVEDCEEALGHQVVDLPLVGSHPVEVMLCAGGDERVVVVHLLVVDHPPERQLVQREHVLR